MKTCPFCQSDNTVTQARIGLTLHDSHECNACGRSFVNGQRIAKRLVMICSSCGVVETWPTVEVSFVHDSVGYDVELEVIVTCPHCGQKLFHGEGEVQSFSQGEIHGGMDADLIHDPADKPVYMTLENYWKEIDRMADAIREKLGFDPVEMVTGVPNMSGIDPLSSLRQILKGLDHE